MCISRGLSARLLLYALAHRPRCRQRFVKPPPRTTPTERSRGQITIDVIFIDTRDDFSPSPRRRFIHPADVEVELPRPLARRFNRIFHGGPHLSCPTCFSFLFYSPAFEARYRRGRGAHTRRIWGRERERRDATRPVESSRAHTGRPLNPSILSVALPGLQVGKSR